MGKGLLQLNQMAQYLNQKWLGGALDFSDQPEFRHEFLGAKFLRVHP